MSTPVTSALQRAIGDAQHALDSHQLSRWLRGSGHLSGGPATADTGLTVEVPGDAEVLLDGQTVAVDEFNNTADVTADDDRPRWSIISVQSDGSVTATDGEPRTLVGDDDQPARIRNPAPPLDYPGVCYAAVFVPAGAAEVTDDEILDRRLGASIRLGSLLADEIDIDEATVSNLIAETATIEGNDSPYAQDPHELGSTQHAADTLANLNQKVSDATLDDTDDARDPTEHGSGSHDGTVATNPHGNAEHSEDFITGVDTADGEDELGEAIRYVFGNNLNATDNGAGEIELTATADADITTIDPNDAVVGEEPTADDSAADNPLAIAVAGNALADDDDTVAIGNGTEASGSNSAALGVDATASAFNSAALARNTTASGSNSAALGVDATASGSNSAALGPDATASGSFSTALGRAAEALSDDVGTLGVSTTDTGPSDWIVPGDFTVNGSKDFEIDHPSDPENKDLRHGAYEGPVPGGLIYNATVSADETRVSLAGELPEYVTNNDFGSNWTCHVTASDHFGRGYVDTAEWALVVEEPGDYEVTIFGERDDERALDNGKHRSEKPKGERWNGDPNTYWRDHPQFDADNYEDIRRIETKFAHTEDCSDEPCVEAMDTVRVTFEDGDREEIPVSELATADTDDHPDPDANDAADKAREQRASDE